uniref:Mitochondrial assembly of ribosomal large subunit protein 1 n=1 Tax=Megafenestra aurita TaxID=2291010 RepID=A0A4Y7NH84_9CRUS|nr:EOG090X0AI9 [Megafenestra aurita]
MMSPIQNLPARRVILRTPTYRMQDGQYLVNSLDETNLKYPPVFKKRIKTSKENDKVIGDEEEEEEFDEFKGISLQRGTTGVFDIEEFIDILHQEKLENIAVIAVPPELNYVDYMVITTGKSAKQMTAVAIFIRKIFKMRRSKNDSLPVVEGKDNKDWIALDLGNIAFHIFSSKARKTYDLETLWTCGAEFDDLAKQEDTLSLLLKEHSFPSRNS